MIVKPLCIGGIIAAIVVSATTLAQTVNAERIVIGWYTPNIYFDDAKQRISFVEQLGESLSALGGMTIQVRSFARHREFMQALKKQSIGLAIVDGPLFVSNGIGGGAEALLIGSQSGHATNGWGCYIRPDSGIATVVDLRGKRLIVPEIGPNGAAFIAAVALGGIADDPARFFSSSIQTQDVRSSLAAVRLRKADATFAYHQAYTSRDPTLGELRLLYQIDAVALPPLVLARTSHRLPVAREHQLVKLFLDARPTKILTPWIPPDTVAINRLTRYISGFESLQQIRIPDLPLTDTGTIDPFNRWITDPTLRLADLRHRLADEIAQGLRGDDTKLVAR